MLHDRGIDLSASQVHRLVSGTPERLSLQVLSALCDILECTPADLVTTTAENAGVRRTATGDLPAPPVGRGSCGPARPASWTTAREPPLRHRRAVRALVLRRLLPLRPPEEQGGSLARRARLPGLRGPRPADPGNLPRLRPGAGPSRTASLRRGGHLPRLRGLLAVLRLRTMRVRGQAARGPALHPLRIRRPPGRAAGRRHRPDPPRACPAGRRPARHGQPAVRPDLALPAPGPPRVRRRPAAAPRPGRDTADPRGVQRPPALAGRLPPARPPDGLRRAPGHRQAALRVRAMAGHPPRHRHRQRPCPGHPPLRHLGSPAQAPRQGRKTAAQHGLARLRRRPGPARHRVPPVALRTGPYPVRVPPGRHRRLARREQREPPQRRPALPPVVHGQQADRPIPAAPGGHGPLGANARSTSG